MRQSLSVVLSLILLTLASPAAQRGETRAPSPEQLAGVWSGTWEGAGGSGGFELTLERAKEAPLSGKVSVTGEPEYKATLKRVSFEGRRMTATYDFPPDPAGEVVLTATFDGDAAAGAWRLREATTGNDVATGTWKVSRKTR